MRSLKIYSPNSKVVESMPLPKLFRGEKNLTLLAQAVHVFRDRSHVGLARTKTRGEVSKTTRKWYRQKGTGRTRHGAQSAPIFVGGGVAHGPMGVKRELSLPQNMRKKALETALALKAEKEKVFVVDGISSLTKTKEAQKLLDKFLKKNGKFTLVLSSENLKQARFFKNIKNGKIFPLSSLNALAVYENGSIIFDLKIFKKGK